MKTVLPQSNLVQKMISKQKMNAEAVYRPSNFCVEANCEEGCLLYNTLTGELVLLSAGETKEQNQEELIQKRFLIPQSMDELAYVDSLRKILRLMPQSAYKTHFTILTTTDCNARCFYCYEKGIPRFSMSQQTARDVISYISNNCGDKEVKISWFGGEPLYNYQAIDTICAGLKAKGIRFTSILTSNGFYLDSSLVRKAKEDWHVITAQITIDGTETIYNKTKGYIDNCPNPYARVLENIAEAVTCGLEIGIRLNMDAANITNLFQLADELAIRFSGKPNVNVHVEPLFEFAGKIHRFKTQDQLIVKYWELTDKLAQLGLNHLPEFSRNLKSNRCIADDSKSEVILPDGEIVKCEHVDRADSVGSIYLSKQDEQRIIAWKEVVRFPECEKCPMYPACIILKKCAWTSNGCQEYVRKIWIERTKRQMVAAWKKSVACISGMK